MITPDNQVPYNDAEDSEIDDQQSQKDIHANGIDDTAEPGDTEDFDDPSNLKQAYDAAEPSYTLNLGDDDHDTSDDD